MKVSVSKSLLYLILAFVAWCPPLNMPGGLTFILRLLVLLIAIDGLSVKKISQDFLFWVIMATFGVQSISVLINADDIHNPLKSIGYLLVLPSVYLVLQHRYAQKKFIKAVLICTCAYLLVDICLMLFTENGLGINANDQAMYFSGGKFTVCYIYILFMAALMMSKELNVWLRLILLAVGIFISLKVSCNTGLMAILAFGVTIFLPAKIYTKKKIYIWIAFLIIFNYLIVGLQVQETNDMLSSFITDVLHRNLNLTGRTVIYNDVTGVMQGHWLLGYGYGNEYVVDYFGLANMQNGFLQLLYISGIIGTVIYIAVLICIIRALQKLVNLTKKKVLLGGLTAFLVVAIVEVPFISGVFSVFIGIIMAGSMLTPEQEAVPEMAVSRPVKCCGID